MRRWEYKIIRGDELKTLNELGEAGWEAVGITVDANAYSANTTMVLLKKRKE